MPPAVAAAAIMAGGAIVGGTMQSRAASGAAKQQTQSANYAADKQAEASRAAEAFQRQQAQNTYQNNEATRHANYDQWKAREGRLGSIGEALGYGRREVPDYVPSVDPRFTGGGAPPIPPPTPGGNGLRTGPDGTMYDAQGNAIPDTGPYAWGGRRPPMGSVDDAVAPRPRVPYVDPRLALQARQHPGVQMPAYGSIDSYVQGRA